ncbi:hypothetical protein [Thalassotalea euphylliae]|uniref:Uncharacterized protein n=1 Tax=Thalassotalea euphylliae TaxID=1655234 RepID=A0A3E0U0I7_9GAMM|nr:hypothetical protein [Thalassotalea euphylliae]REL30087.1 hypothetical protein DXX94_04875 [Thalassotalea euphylliae]
MTKYNEQLTLLRSPLFLYALFFGLLAALVLTFALGIRALWFVEHEQQMLKEELLEFKQEILDIYHEDGAMGVREELATVFPNLTNFAERPTLFKTELA